MNVLIYRYPHRNLPWCSGTFTGASALAWAIELPENGQVISMDVSHEWLNKVNYFLRAISPPKFVKFLKLEWNIRKFQRINEWAGRLAPDRERPCTSWQDRLPSGIRRWYASYVIWIFSLFSHLIIISSGGFISFTFQNPSLILAPLVRSVSPSSMQTRAITLVTTSSACSCWRPEESSWSIMWDCF